MNDVENNSNTFHRDEPDIKSTNRFPNPFFRVLYVRLFNVKNESVV